MEKYGVLLVSHSYDLAKGLSSVIQEVAPNVPITQAGGINQGSIGTSLDRVLEAVAANEGESLLAFYDLGSAKGTLDNAKEITDRTIKVYDVAFTEGAYTAATLLQAGVDMAMINKRLFELTIQK